MNEEYKIGSLIERINTGERLICAGKTAYGVWLYTDFGRYTFWNYTDIRLIEAKCKEEG